MWHCKTKTPSPTCSAKRDVGGGVRIRSCSTKGAWLLSKKSYLDLFPSSLFHSISSILLSLIKHLYQAASAPNTFIKAIREAGPALALSSILIKHLFFTLLYLHPHFSQTENGTAKYLEHVSFTIDAEQRQPEKRVSCSADALGLQRTSGFVHQVQIEFSQRAFAS